MVARFSSEQDPKPLLEPKLTINKYGVVLYLMALGLKLWSDSGDRDLASGWTIVIYAVLGATVFSWFRAVKAQPFRFRFLAMFTGTVCYGLSLRHMFLIFANFQGSIETGVTIAEVLWFPFAVIGTAFGGWLALSALKIGGSPYE